MADTVHDYMKEVNGGALASWNEAISVMQTFRQGIGVGRRPGRTMPGRSRWPEAESVRELTVAQRSLSSRPSGWNTLDPSIPSPACYFPRAELGMPIILEIRESVPYPPGRNGSPPYLKPTLQYGAKKDRMASPLILRPMRFANNTTVAMIVRLNTEPLNTAYLKRGDRDLKHDVSIPGGQIRDSAVAANPCSPLHSRSSTGSALEAFIAFVKEKGFKEIKP